MSSGVSAGRDALSSAAGVLREEVTHANLAPRTEEGSRG
jgi:hypothetical protein